ncbi:hypothetical protein Poly59_36110 [Rubripirellula reticaptiva]|uniref:Uncharacterized protein n=1 Tax=Rubripirellula reticaptiva TaxID=2528013 RepID=A0A5C6EUE1_9BACT|nr:hypothetical protein Poly59_36110 [Rubripirellula reticaptiva]
MPGFLEMLIIAVIVSVLAGGAYLLVRAATRK